MYGHVTWVPDPYMSTANARTLCLTALLLSAVLVALPLLAWGAWCLLRAGYRNIQACIAAALDDDTQATWAGEITQPLPLVVPPDPIAQHADRLADFAGPTYRYPVITDADWDTAVHQLHADIDAWESSQ